MHLINKQRMNIHKTFICLVLFCHLFIDSFGQSVVNLFLPYVESSDEQGVKEGYLLHLNTDVFEYIITTKPERFTTIIPVGIDKSYVVTVQKKRIYPEEGLNIVTSSGSSDLVDIGDFYFGTIEPTGDDLQTSRVILSVFDNRILGSVFIDNDEVLNISPYQNNAYRIISENQFRPDNLSFTCYTNDGNNLKTDNQDNSNKNVQANNIPIGVYLETDHLTYLL